MRTIPIDMFDMGVLNTCNSSTVVEDTTSRPSSGAFTPSFVTTNRFTVEYKKPQTYVVVSCLANVCNKFLGFADHLRLAEYFRKTLNPSWSFSCITAHAKSDPRASRKHRIRIYLLRSSTVIINFFFLIIIVVIIF
jgi:hypothetical protein